MCSDSQNVEATDNALMTANAAANQNFLADAKTAFAGQQNLIARQTALANQMVTNPLGYSPQELKSMTTNINENFAGAAKKALGSAAAFGATHGAADVGGGGAAQMAGEIGATEAGGAAGARAQLESQNQEMKRQNMLAGLSELNQAGAGAGEATKTAIGGAGETGTTGLNAGAGALSAANTGWEDFGAALSGAAGVGMSAAKLFAKH